ncbi:MAG: twin-arginine translocase TatA/TatE family subunit [Kiritimatiellia bacterium]|nr:twin-arginine translocase TatA/TatE family subunit [Kiritimatiellia bacterium]
MTMPMGFLQNFSGPEMLLVLAVIVLLFGAKKLPELARSVGKSINEFKRGKEEGERLGAEKAKELLSSDQPKDGDAAKQA